MPSVSNERSVWWREPHVWLLIALPLSAVIGGVVTIWLASHGADTLVAEDYYKQGLAVHQVLDRETRAQELGLEATLEATGKSLVLHLEGSLDRYPAKLILRLVHPTAADQDTTLLLTATDKGLYRAELPEMTAGIRRLILEPENQAWRLTGRWRTPLDGSITLNSKTQTSSTHP